MVRLNPLNAELKTEEIVGGGAQAQVVDDILASVGKRSRPSSSLDYKSRKENEQTVLPDIMSKPTEQQQPPRIKEPEPVKQVKTATDPRLEALQDKGVPFVQWAVVLFVVGYGFFRLYKLLAGQPKKIVPKLLKKKKAATPKKLSKSIPQASETPSAKSPPKKQQPAKKPIVAKQPAQEPAVIQVAPPETPTVEDDGKKLKKKKPKKKRDGAPNENDGSSKETSEIAKPIHADTADDEDGWETVGANGAANKASAVKTMETKPLNGDSVVVPPPAVAEELAAAADDFVPPKAAKKKKKKAKSADTEATHGAIPMDESAANNNTNTDLDEALAQKLQDAENNMSAAATVAEDEWAEVAAKKKKPKE
jgi:hypothetical protein